jgi:hypothetical protein
MMKQVKACGRKSWNCGWRHRDRATLNRGIERRFRQTERKVVGEFLADVDDLGEIPPPVLSRQQILDELSILDELIDACGSLSGCLEDEQAQLFDLLEDAV